MHLSKFPRIQLGHFDTPLEPMPRLSDLLGGPKLFIKRDDCTGLATGGNKTRKLEFLIADALRKVQIRSSRETLNRHARQTAAALRRYGNACVFT